MENFVRNFVKKILAPFYFKYHNRAIGEKLEIEFWEKWIKRNGDIYFDDFVRRTDHKAPLRSPHSDFLFLMGRDIKILDVGSGPITNIGYSLPEKNIQIFACDPNANAYNKILDKYNIFPPVRSVQIEGERLCDFFAPEFDYITCINALDHTRFPILCIEQMVLCLKRLGGIMLIHEYDEGVKEGYRGYHKWNICFHDKSSFKVWNPKCSILVNKDVLGLECIVWRSESHIFCFLSNNLDLINCASNFIFD